MTQLSKVKQNIQKHTHKLPYLENITRKAQSLLYELFLLTVPIEEVAHLQYKTVLIIFFLYLQTITNSDIVEWRGKPLPNHQKSH